MGILDTSLEIVGVRELWKEKRDLNIGIKIIRAMNRIKIKVI